MWYTFQEFDQIYSLKELEFWIELVNFDLGGNIEVIKMCGEVSGKQWKGFRPMDAVCGRVNCCNI